MTCRSVDLPFFFSLVFLFILEPNVVQRFSNWKGLNMIMRGHCTSSMGWTSCGKMESTPLMFSQATKQVYTWIPWNLIVISLHLFHEKRLQTMLWHHNVRVNSHERWKQTHLMVPRLLSSLVWIDQYNECNGMTSFMEFMISSKTNFVGHP